jgi:hypothetical protein
LNCFGIQVVSFELFGFLGTFLASILGGNWQMADENGKQGSFVVNIDRKVIQGDSPLVIAGQYTSVEGKTDNFQVAIPIMPFLTDGVVQKWLSNDELVELGNACDAELSKRRKAKEQQEALVQAQIAAVAANNAPSVA